MKKLLSVALVIIITLGMIIVPTSAASYSDVQEQGKMKEAIDRLSSLGVIVGYPDGTFKPSNSVTRAEFMSLIIRALGLSDVVSGKVEKNPFIDVPADHWAAGDIKYGSDIKIISGYGNNLFGPEDKITYEQCVKILVNITGHGLLAENSGGYPSGYMSIAYQNGVMKGITKAQTDFASRGDIALMLYETMNIQTIIQDGYGSNEVSYKKSGTNLMNELLRLKDSAIYRGVVTANEITDLNNINGESNLYDGQVKIEDTILNAGNSGIEKYLGYMVEYYIKNDQSGSIPVVTSAIPYKNNTFDVNIEDINNIDSNYIYYNDAKEVEKKVGFKSQPAIVYNGKAALGILPQDLNLSMGNIKLLDNNNDGKYDILFVSEYKSFLVDKVSVGTETIFIKDDTFDGLNRINLDSDNDKFHYEILNIDGAKLEISDIKADDVITVEMDLTKTAVKITVSNAKLNGKIESYYNDDKVTLGGKEYKVIKLENGNYAIEFNLNKSGSYYLDVYKNIVAFEEDSTMLDKVAYIIKKGEYREYSQDGYQIKVVTGNFLKPYLDENDVKYFESGNSDVKILNMASSVKINGVKKSGDQIAAVLDVGKLITYKMNSSNQVTEINVIDAAAESAKRSFNSSISSFGGKFYVSEKSTSVINIPESIANAQDEDYLVKIELTNNKTYQIAAFEIDEKTKIAKYAVIIEKMKAGVSGSITPSTDPTIITKISSKYADENSYCIFEGYRNGELINVQIPSDSAVYNFATGLKMGDVILFSTNSRGDVDNITFIQSLGKKPDDFFYIDETEGNEKFYGRLDEIIRDELSESRNIEESVFKINIIKDPIATPKQKTITQESTLMPPIYMIDTARNKVSIITLDDLYSSTEVGTDRASEIFICKRNNRVKAVVLVK